MLRSQHWWYYIAEWVYKVWKTCWCYFFFSEFDHVLIDCQTPRNIIIITSFFLFVQIRNITSKIIRASLLLYRRWFCATTNHVHKTSILRFYGVMMQVLKDTFSYGSDMWWRRRDSLRLRRQFEVFLYRKQVWFIFLCIQRNLPLRHLHFAQFVLFSFYIKSLSFFLSL